MVQRDNNKDASVNYLTSIIQWIHNNPTPTTQQATKEAAIIMEPHHQKTNPRQQLMFTRNLKRNRHRSVWRALPEFNQQPENIMTDDQHLT